MKKQPLLTTLSVIIFAFLFTLAADRLALAQSTEEDIPPIEGELSLALETPRRPVELGEQFEITITVQNDRTSCRKASRLSCPTCRGCAI